MAKRTVQRQGSRATGVDPISTRFMHFMSLGLQAKDLVTRADVLKKDLAEHAKEHGTVDEEKGHKVYLLASPVEVGGKTFTGFMQQKRVPSPAFNEERAQELCEAKGLPREDFITTQEYVDQDKVYRLYADDLLTDEEMKSLLDQGDPTWAFVPIKAT